MPYIKKIKAREILDSRGMPTIEVEVVTTSNVVGKAKVPSGASTGMYEALELRDNDKNRLLGKGVLKAVNNVNESIASSLVGKNIISQREIDEAMIKLDGSKNKDNLGANAILGVSLAISRAASNYYNMPLYKYLNSNEDVVLPIPLMNIMNGGAHASNGLDFQEYMIVPFNFEKFSDALRAGVEIFYSLKRILNKLGKPTSLGDEGGFAPSLSNNEEPLKLIMQAIQEANYEGKVAIALDVAASEFYDEDKEKYILKNENKELTSKEFAEYLNNLVNNYPIVSIEDGMDENDYEGWKLLSETLDKDILLVGDDLFVTNKERLQKGIDLNIANSILIKLNQIGTLSETLDTIKCAKENDYHYIISHRSGETSDTFIADLAVSSKSGLIKTGSLSRSERIEKYNRLLKIEEDNENSKYGLDSLKERFNKLMN